MFRFILLLVLFAVFARLFWRFVEGVVRGAMPPGGPRPNSAPSPVKMQPCPVCGTFVVPGKAISGTSSGATVHFCSEKCRSEHAVR